MKIELKVNGKEVTLSKETLKQIKKEVKDEFEIGSSYFCLDTEGDLINPMWHNDKTDNRRMRFGNTFKTKEEAEKEIEFKKAVTRVKNYIKDTFGYDPCNWANWEDEDNDECKYYFYFNYSDKELNYDYNYIYKHCSQIGYIKTSEEVKELIEKCKEDLELIIKS